MEEVDQIIIHALRSIECDIDDSITSCRGFDDDTLYRSVVRCIQFIDPQKEFKTSLPTNMSAKVHTCAELAQTVKEMGYRGDLGYHQFLYPTDNDTRNLLNWLTSKLPRTEAETSSASAENTQESGELLQQAIDSKLKILLKETWNPFIGISSNLQNYEKINNLHTSPIYAPFPSFEEESNSQSKSKALEQIKTNQDYITRQPARRIDVVPSILEHNLSHLIQDFERKAEWESEGLESGLNRFQFCQQKRNKIVKQMGDYIRYSLEESEAAFAKSLSEQEKKRAAGKIRKTNRFTNLVEYAQEESTFTPKESEEDLKKRREEELAVLEEQINNLKMRLEQVQKDMESFRTDIKQGDARIIAEDQKYASLEERWRIDKTVFEELLPDAANNIKLLQDISQKSVERLLQLGKEWEQHRASLIDAYRKFKAQHINRKGGTADLLNNIKSMRLQIEQLKKETNEKDDQYRSLIGVYEQLPKNINRSVYTSRILEIVRQVKKQKVDINKILFDTRTLQKEINSNIETLGRTFGLTSEIIYLDAKAEKKGGDNTAKRAYKDIVTLHEKFKELSDRVSESGNISNQILDLEEKLSQVQIRAGSVDLEKITQDLDQIKQENRTLMTKLAM